MGCSVISFVQLMDSMCSEIRELLSTTKNYSAFYALKVAKAHSSNAIPNFTSRSRSSSRKPQKNLQTEARFFSFVLHWFLSCFLS